MQRVFRKRDQTIKGQICRKFVEQRPVTFTKMMCLVKGADFIKQKQYSEVPH